MIRQITTALCFALTLSAGLTACGNNAPSSPESSKISQPSSENGQSNIQTNTAQTGSVNLMSGITAGEVKRSTVPSEDPGAAFTEFSLRLLQNSIKEGENTLISPLSILCALGMTANGADNETLTQMENTFGMSVDELNQYLYNYIQSLPQGDKYKLTLADAIWIRNSEDVAIQEEFLQANADWYDAGLYQAPFDASTVKDINDWVRENTDGMIQDILNDIQPEDIMYLVNALAFDAEWQSIYGEHQIRNGIFTAADGTEQVAEMMSSEEHCYLEDESATGFLKYYAEGSYAFVALLPNEGISTAEYIASLSGKKLQEMLDNVQKTTVHASTPKFQCEYSVEISQPLMSMGMVNAFDPQEADFSRMGTAGQGNLYISTVLHKTYIAVDEKGTKAGAATAVGIDTLSAPMDPKYVRLDRPFVYMLIDCEEKLPVFIGTLESLK